MIEKILKAKHWQIFIITFGLPFLIQIILMLMTIIKDDPMMIIRFFPIIMILYIGGYFGWFWSIAIGLQKVIPTEIQLKINRFKIFVLIPVFYIIFFLGFFMTSFHLGGPNPVILAIIVPLHLFSMFCIFYSMYFVAKIFKTVELQRNVTFSDFAGEFLMIWFLPIGIWILQPKINKMIESKV